VPSLILLNIIAAVCLLLWGLRHLKSGMMKGFGTELRFVLQKGTQNRFYALGSGVLVTLLVQSSTAAILIVGSFLAQGLVAPASGVALALGADLGTALVAAFLSMDLSWLMPFLIIIGYVMYLIKFSSRVNNLGKVLSGLGLMLLSLTWIREVSAPLKESEVLPVVLHPLAGDPIFGIVLTAIMTWIMHSSLAMILLLVSLTTTGVIPVEFAFYLVLGANLGGAMPAIMATWNDDRKASHLALANGLFRFIGVCVLFSFVPFLSTFIEGHVADDGQRLISFHLLFNVILCICALPFTASITHVTAMLRPEQEDDDDDGRPRYLNVKDFDTPGVALANAERETLRMAELLEDMLERSIDTFRTQNQSLINAIQQEDHDIDRLYAAIKDYLAKLLSRESLDEKQATRALYILTFSTNIEHAGDIIDKNLMALATKRVKKSQRFSDQGFQEIRKYHELVMESVVQAQKVFMSDDKQLAKVMLENKRGILREAEENAMLQHFKRLQEGIPETMSTTSLHLDIIRDLRRINTHVCAVAYDILEEQKAEEKLAVVSDLPT
jgi:phosphate:Na+ symporter